METVKTHYFCQDQVISREVVQYFPIADKQGVPTSLGAWEWATILVDADVPAVPAGVTLTLTVEISHDGVAWFPIYIHNLQAAANKWVLVGNIALAAGNTVAGLIGVSSPAPYIRLGAISAGDWDTTLTAIFVGIT